MDDSLYDAFFAGCAELGLATPELANLEGAFRLSADRIEFARARLASEIHAEAEVDVVAFGSIARREMTIESDFDYSVVAYGLPATSDAADEALRVADHLRTEFGEKEVAKPGAAGVFGTVVSGPEIAENIGLQADTNHTQTRRILLLEESVSLRNPARHLELLTTIVERYLADRLMGSDGVLGSCSTKLVLLTPPV